MAANQLTLDAAVISARFARIATVR